MQWWNPNKRVVSTGSFFAICKVLLILLLILCTMQLTSGLLLSNFTIDVFIDCIIFAMTKISNFLMILEAL